MFAFITLFAASADADFATSGSMRSRAGAGSGVDANWAARPAHSSQNSRTIFHRGVPSAGQTNAARSIPSGGDPFIDFDHSDPGQGVGGGNSVGDSVGYSAGGQNQPLPAGSAPDQNGAARQAAEVGQAGRGQDWIHPSVVRVRAVEDEGLANGSGTLIGVDDKHGYVITNWHVVQGATGQVTVEFPDGFQSSATVMKTDADWDLAILVIWKPTAPPMPLSPNLPSPGEPLIIAGYGQGAFRSAKGAMTEFVAPTKDLPFEMFEVSTAARQGDSGGPIVNMQGQLAGVLFGAGDGRTTGSHVGRLRMFLDEAFRPPAAADAPQATAANIAQVEPPRSAAQQPAAFHESPQSAEMNALAQQVSAGLPEEPLSDVSIEIPGEPAAALPLQPTLQPVLVAQANQPIQSNVTNHLGMPAVPMASPVATTTPAVIGGGVNNELLAGIPVAAPYEYGVARQPGPGGSTFGAYGAGPAAAGGLPPRRGGGSAFGELKTFLVLFGVFAVVFVLLPRDRG